MAARGSARTPGKLEVLHLNLQTTSILEIRNKPNRFRLETLSLFSTPNKT
jgi:hypothetical protein